MRLAAVVVLALLLLALSPSKWSYHLGSMAGLNAAFLVTAVVLVVRRAREGGAMWPGVAGGVLLAAAAAVSFDRVERSLAEGEAWSGFDRGIGGGAYFHERDNRAA